MGCLGLLMCSNVQFSSNVKGAVPRFSIWTVTLNSVFGLMAILDVLMLDAFSSLDWTTIMLWVTVMLSTPLLSTTFSDTGYWGAAVVYVCCTVGLLAFIYVPSPKSQM